MPLCYQCLFGPKNRVVLILLFIILIIESKNDNSERETMTPIELFIIHTSY